MTLLFLSLLLDQEEEPKPLADAVIYVSKKLSKRQRELNAVAASLGADYRYLPIQWLLSFCADVNSNNFESLHPSMFLLQLSIRFHPPKQHYKYPFVI